MTDFNCLLTYFGLFYALRFGNYQYLDNDGGACGVMVIITGCGLGDTSSNPGRD